MVEILDETKIDQSKVYFHGSSEARVNQLKAPSTRHPFYVTPDLHYAMAFCTKDDSQTGDYEDEDKIYTPASQNFVYCVSLKPTCKAFDFRDHNSSEFKKLYKVVDQEIVEWIVKRNSKNFDMSDIFEFVVALQASVVKLVDMSRANYLEYTKLFGTEPELMTPKLFSKACAFCKNNGLYETWGDFSVHQTMTPILEGLKKQGFHAILTRETDFNDEDPDKPGSKVSTSYALGVFDKAGIDLVGLVPLRYNWLKRINPTYLKDRTEASAGEKIERFIKLYKRITEPKNLEESAIEAEDTWYFGNNRSRNLKLAKPSWDAPFFLTTSYEYAEDYSDYGVYKIELADQRDLNVLDFSNEEEVQKLGWPEVLVDKILEGRNDLNSLAYDLYLLANGEDKTRLMYIQDSDEWLDAAIWFQDRSEDIFKLVKSKGIWGSEKDHQFLLQMWKDIYDAGFDGFTHQEFGHKILALFDLKYIDKISVKPASKQVNEASRLSLSDVLLQLKQQVNDAGARCDSIEVLNDKFHHNTVVLYGDFHDKIALDTLRFNYTNGDIAIGIDKGWYEGTRCMNKWRDIVKPIIDSLLPNGIEEGSSVQLHEKKKHRLLKKHFNAKGQDTFPKIKSDDDIVFINGIQKDKALQLLKRACHNVSNFHPEYMEKAIKWSDDQIFGVFNKHDKRNVLAMASVSYNGDESGAAYLHEMTGFIKGGYGKKLVMWLLQKFKKVYGQIALEGSGTKDDPYRPNEKLRDKFYATIPGMKIYRVENSIWNCPADFFYYGISDESIKEFLETTYGSKQSTLNEDHHQFYDIDKNDEVVAKCRNPIGKIGISIYDDINAVGIGSFEIFKPYRRMGHAKNVLKKLVKKLNSKYDLVYCFVDKDNYPALSLYKQLGKVSNHLNANGQYEVVFWKAPKDEYSTSSKNIKNLFDEVVSKYKDIFGFDLSYMAFKVDRQPVYTNGEPCYEYDEDECAGDWTELGWIRLNPDMKSVMDRYGVAWHGSDDIEEFTKIIIAHELAHEVWNNIADDQFKEDVLDEARMQSFSTKYLDTVNPSVLDMETFCEYLAHQVVQQKKDISFPDEEIAYLSKQNHIVTHRVSDDANRFNVGDVVMPSWGIPYKVSSKLIVDKIEDSPYVNDLTPQQLAFLDDFNEIAVLELDAQYDPPYTLEQIKARYPENIYNMLANDPVHKWRAETGIELIHKEPTEEELDRIWKNWQLMPQDMKDISDKKSNEMFGCTNAEHYNQLKALEDNLNENKATYLQKYRDESDVKSIVDMFWSIRDRLSAPQNDIDWWIKKPFNDLKSFVQNFDRSNKRQRRDANYRLQAIDNGAKMLDTKDGYEMWYVPTYDAMVAIGRFYKGRSAKWCVASDDPDFWFDNHEDSEFVVLVREHPQNDEFDKVAIEMMNHGRYYNEDDVIPWDLENEDWTFTDDNLIHEAWLLFKDNGETREQYFG